MVFDHARSSAPLYPYARYGKGQATSVGLGAFTLQAATLAGRAGARPLHFSWPGEQTADRGACDIV